MQKLKSSKMYHEKQTGKKKVYALYDKELKSLFIKSSYKTITKRQNTHQQKKLSRMQES